VIPYWAILRARFQSLLQYRAAAAAGFATQVFWGFIRVMIFAAFLRSGAPSPMTIEEVVTYVWLGQALLMILPWRPDPEVEQSIRTGTVAYELLRPLDLYNHWFARAVAFRSAPTLLRSVPLLVLAWLFFGMRLPAGLPALLAFLGAMAAALLLSAAITTLINVTMMWTIAGQGTWVLVSALAWLFSGMIVPLPLFPDWAQPVLAVLPFRGLMDAPFRLYMGHLPAAHAVATIVHQLAWSAAFVMFGRWLLSRGTRRLVVQGG
jgi:ABC-2 type transport system permease protein